MKKVLIACEESQTVCRAFRELGFEAYSNDVIDCSGGHPEWHLKMDALEAIKLQEWDLLIAHPACTRLTRRAQYWNKKKQLEEEFRDAVSFFMSLVNAPIRLKAIENPIGVMSRIYRKPDQIIQPYQYGNPERKATCLWLFCLPGLVPTKITEPNLHKTRSGRLLSFNDKFTPSPDRAKLRSRTFPGIAQAMAKQWGDYILSL